MRMLSIKEVRENLPQLVDDACHGRETVILRHGRKLAKIVPISQPGTGPMPDLSSMRAAMGKAPARKKSAIELLRESERF
jgi:antitoxin (DNA-binding transcriptional repressor) of toxin-antitoxin stability system